MHLTLHRWLAGTTVMVSALLCAMGAALAQTPWPAKSIRFVVGYAPGGMAGYP